MSDSRVDVEQPSSWEVRWKGLTFKVPDKANGQKTILDDCAGAMDDELEELFRTNEASLRQVRADVKLSLIHI